MSDQRMNRRAMLKAAGAAAAYAAIAKLPDLSGADDPGAGKRPNILLMIGDDHAFTDAGCYGNKEVQTPNIDRLADQGMRFTRCFTASAMCAPTRSMLYTGLYPVRNGAHPNHSEVKPGTRSIAHYLKALGYRVALAGKTHIGPKDCFPFEYIPATPQSVERFLTAAKDGPFCLIYASNNPHAPWRRGLYDPAKLAVPPHLVDTPETRQALADYYFEVTELDKEAGSCTGLLDKLALTNDTLTIYTSEQGAQFPHGKWTCYDAGLHTQFIARWPGRIAAGSVSNAMISYADFVPTAVELAGGAPVAGLDGKSFAGVLAGKTDKHHDAVFGVHTTRGIIEGSACYPIRSIRTATHKYIWNPNWKEEFRNILTSSPSAYWKSWIEKAKTDRFAAERVALYQRRPEEELYDLANDPWELNNIAADPANAALKADLRRRLDVFMASQGDKGIETEMAVAINKTTGKTEAE